MIYTGSLRIFCFYIRKEVLTIKCQKKLRLKVILPSCCNVSEKLKRFPLNS